MIVRNLTEHMSAAEALRKAQAARIAPQWRMRHRDVNVADRNRNPLHEMDVLPGKAAVEIRLNRLLEEFLAYQIRMALADDLVRRHLPVALVDRIDPLKTV